jgi:succinate dehydrogenase/fumarate reductase iron-sulfur protein
MATITVYRFDPETDSEPRFESHLVPEGPGIMVLDALNHIRDTTDPGLRYRHSCHMGKCGSCAVTIDGRPGLACWEPVKNGMRSEPLRGLPVVADLVVERPDSPPVMAGDDNGGINADTAVATALCCRIEHRAALDEVRKCIHCYACVSACPYIHTDRTGFAGPEPMVETARHAYDPRTEAERVLKAAVHLGVWDCVSCRACTDACPQQIDGRRRVLDLRAEIMARPELKGIPTHTMQLNERILKAGTPYGLKAGRPGQWAEGLDLPVITTKTLRELVYFPGCSLNSDDRGRETAARLAVTLQTAGVDIGRLDGKEVCCGDPARTTGEVDLFALTRDRNLDRFRRLGISRMVTACPHGLNTFRHDYGPDAPTVVHYSQMLAERLRGGSLRFHGSFPRRTTYHDPCYLGRMNGVYDAPREVLRSIPGLQYLEMDDSRERSLCCGGGGGGAFIETDAEPRLSCIRVRQAVETGAEVLAVACPFCFTMLDDAVKVENLTLEVKHLSDIVAESL